MQKILYLFFLLSISTISVCQNTQFLEFNENTHDFGQIKESLGEVKTIFKFKNTGNKSISIEKIYAGCGCTTSNYTKGEILPGKSGVVEAIYHTTNNLGSFNKYLIVFTSDSSNKGIYLYLKGYVFRGEKIIEEKYTQALGNLKFKSNHVAFNIMKNTGVKTDTLWFYNSFKKKMKIEFVHIPEWISIKPNKINLKSTFENYVLITYDASKRNDWGLNFDKISLKTNDDTLAEKSFYVSAQIEEDFSKLSEVELLNSPRLFYKETEYNFGEVNEGSNIFYRFEIQNTGKSDLIIRKITAACGCTYAETDKKLIKSGESSFISVSFNTNGRVGDQHKTISVVTNDPHQPFVVLSLIGSIKN